MALLRSDEARGVGGVSVSTLSVNTILALSPVLVSGAVCMQLENLLIPRHWRCEPGLNSDQPLCCSGYHEPGRCGVGGCSSGAQAAPALSGLDLSPSL